VPDASATLLATVIKCYNAVYANCATAAVATPITQTDVYSQLPNGSARLSEVLYNSYGVVTDDKEYDYGATMGSAPGTTKLVSETLTTFAGLGNTIFDRPASVTVKDWSSGSAVTLASSTYGYDAPGSITTTTGTPQHTSVTGWRGNLTSIATQASTSGTTLYRNITNYDTGMLNTITDLGTTSAGGPNLTTYNYADATSTCGNTFPTSISEPASLSRSFTWNCAGTVVHTATDENGQVVKTDYTDSDFWRPADVFDQKGSETTISYIGQTAVESSQIFNSSQSVADFRATIDSFGRSILSQKLQGPGATNYDTVETDYNVAGQPYRSTMPFQATAGGTSTTAPSTTAVYDALGRPTLVTDGGGGTTLYVYTNNDVLQTVGPTQNFKKQFEYDGLGRLSSVCEITAGTTTWPGGTCAQTNSETGYWTKYTYDALGNLLTVTQNAQSSSHQTRTYTYDMMSRRTSEANPESGTTTYFWDAAPPVCYSPSGYPTPGDLGAKKNNAGIYTCYGYDGLHRLVGADETLDTNCRSFVYDSGSPPAGVSVQNTKNRLVEAYTNSACNGHGSVVTDEWFSYDADGQLTDVYESTPHSGGYYHTSASYWATGAINSLSALTASGTAIFPNIYYGTNTNTGLDGEGRITKVTAASGTNPLTSATYVTSGTTEPIGALTSVTLGSADSDSFTFDPLTGRQKSYAFSVNGVNDTGTLTWNANGTLGTLAIVDNLSGTTDSQTCNYFYDDLARLGGANSNGYSVDCGTKWQQLFTFDPFGNMKQSGTASFTPIYSTSTNQFSSISGVNPPYYDASGNLTKDNLNTYTWDGYGYPNSINTTTLIHDAFGRLVEEQNGSTYIQMLYTPAGQTAVMNGQTLIKASVNLPGGGVAIYNSSSSPAYYRHADWLGSSRLTTTPSHAIYSDSAYSPYGEQYALTGSADASFTGQNSDVTSTLYGFAFRENSPTQGRWISPDPAGLGVVDPTNPQTWNRYAYVGNNPLAFVDPLGLFMYVPSGCWVEGEYPDNYIVCPSYPSGGPGLTGQGPSPIGGGPGGGGSPDPKPPVLKRGQPQCGAQLKTRKVNDPTAQLLSAGSATHSFWYVQDSLGNQNIVSGGPSNGFLDVWTNSNINGGVDNVSAGTTWNSGLSANNCSGVAALEFAADTWPQNTISYNPLGPNSNGVANFLGTAGDFSPLTPPGAFGWDAPLLPF
jgi:RHS repeat-associated protein